MQSSFIVSKPNKVVLVPYDRVKGLWPDIKCIDRNGAKLAIVPHGPREQIQLRAAGIEAPAPILYPLRLERWHRRSKFRRIRLRCATSTRGPTFSMTWVLAKPSSALVVALSP